MARHLEVGKRGEDLAARNLQRRRYRILERNYRCRFGEIDIVAMDGDTVVFVEVKTRSSDVFGRPETSITERKQQQLTRAALAYLQQQSLSERSARFDVVSVELREHGETVTLIQNAFEMPS